jgi:hypothetical protein
MELPANDRGALSVFFCPIGLLLGVLPEGSLYSSFLYILAASRKGFFKVPEDKGFFCTSAGSSLGAMALS